MEWKLVLLVIVKTFLSNFCFLLFSLQVRQYIFQVFKSSVAYGIFSHGKHINKLICANKTLLKLKYKNLKNFKNINYYIIGFNHVFNINF